MLTYTFTTREKFLIALLAIVIAGVSWYYFVYATVQLRMTALESQIAAAQEQVSTASSQVFELDAMRSEIERYQAEGRVAVQMPPYDNTKALMDMLNATIGVGKFKLSTDELDVQTAGMVKRGMTVEFRASSYEAARAILDALAEGDFPCSVESVSISDESARRGSSDEAPFVVVAHLTFYEEDVNGIFAAYATSEDATGEGATSEDAAA